MADMTFQVANSTVATKREARELTDRICRSVPDLAWLVLEAYQRQVWKALAYPDWRTYVAREFDRAPLMMRREDRKAMTMFLHGHGMSTRAIAAVEGTGEITVRRDLSSASFHAAGGVSSPGDPPPIVGSWNTDSWR